MPTRALSLLSLAPLAVVMLLTGVAGCAAEAGDAEATRLGQQASAIQGGVTDTSAAHNFAVGVANRAGGMCSGTLIAPNLVLTARHCVTPPSEDSLVTCASVVPASLPASDISVTTEPNLNRATSYYAATKIITPETTAFCGNDIALIVLAKNVPASEAQPAVPVVAFAITDKRLSGDITAMGYGITNPSATDSGQRRIRENIALVCVPGSADMACRGDNARYESDANEFVTEGYVCSGDSGSGAFDQRSFDAGVPYVLGTLSRSPLSKDQCLTAIYTRTDAHAQLIIDAGILAARQGGYEPPGWTVPEAPSASDDGAGETTCTGDTCTDTSATEPDALASSEPSAASSGCSAAPGDARGAGGAGALFGLAALAVVVSRRRARSLGAR